MKQEDWRIGEEKEQRQGHEERKAIWKFIPASPNWEERSGSVVDEKRREKIGEIKTGQKS